jgi:hypothetical protein
MTTISEADAYSRQVQGLLAVLFSWIVLLGISVIISGKLVAQHIVLNFSDEDVFSINLIFFKVRARGDEVSLGFILFLLCFGIVLVFGGQGAYLYFKTQAGIDIGHWNSMCAISSLLCIFELHPVPKTPS